MSRPLGITTVMILIAIERRVCYGLDIVNRTGLLPGTVYTTLRRLERKGHVSGRWEEASVAESERRPRRRYYELTPSGRSALAIGRSHFAEMGVEIPSGVAVAGDSE